MAVFIVAAREASDELDAAIKRAYPEKHHQFTDRVWFVSSKETAQEVSEKINVTKGGITGVVVFRGNGAYWGVASTTVWDWLKVAVEDGADGK